MDRFLKEISDIRFTSVEELYKRRDEIRELYLWLDLSTKQIYKWYFYYQLCLVKNSFKEALWEYLNGNDSLELQSRLAYEWKVFNRRKDR